MNDRQQWYMKKLEKEVACKRTIISKLKLKVKQQTEYTNALNSCIDVQQRFIVRHTGEHAYYEWILNNNNKAQEGNNDNKENHNSKPRWNTKYQSN